jgi:hypothetical protein
MKKTRWFSPVTAQRITGSLGVAVLMMMTGAAVAQDATTAPQPVAPNGYTLHESIDLGGHMAGIYGSGAMYDTMVNIESGPRVLGETFELHALPGTKHTLVDSLGAFSNGFGGDPDNYARIDFYKGNLYQFSGNFFRDRQYFDYDLLGNPNIPSGLTTPISGSTTPYTFPQVNQSPFLYNTVRRRTNANLTLFPVSKLSYQAGYSQDVFQGPSLTPSGYQFASSYAVLLQEMQRNSTDEFTGEIDWKPVPLTRLTFEEIVDHYKNDSYFNMDPSYLRLQEPDGTKVALLYSYDSTAPSISCNANSTGGNPNLSAPSTPGGLPVVNPACAVISSYSRTAPTRIIYPTEIFRFQSSSIRNISMNGDVRYTKANMSLPLYQDIFQGLTKSSTSNGVVTPPYRSIGYTATASAKREVTAIDYAVEWRATRDFSFDEQFTFSNEQEPGVATMTSKITSATPTTAGNETINYPTLTTTAAAAGAGTFEGSGAIGTPDPDFFGQRFITNDLTGTWNGWSRATFSLTYRHVNHIIAEGIPHSAPLALGATTNGTVTINQNGGIFNAALRPDEQWNIDGSVEVLYADNVFTPVAPRQLQHYRVHALYRPKSWATLSGVFNDMELHNNTNNNQADIVPPFTGSPTGTAYDGPLDHVAHTRVVGLGAELSPNEHYALDLNYAYSDVYTSTNICYLGGATATLPGAATQSGTVCPATAANRGGTWDFGPTRDFEDAPTNSLQAALTYSPVKTLKSNIGYNLNAVDGSRFYNDARDVAGSLHSTYQSPFVAVAWTVRPGFIWNAQYNYYGYGEGGASGAPYCTTAGPTPTTPSTVVPCNSSTLAGLQTGLTLPNSGETAPRDFHANIVTLGFHYEF